MTTARLSLLCGLPGAGKSTLAGRLREASGAVRFDCDDFMASWGVDLWDEPFRASLEEHVGALAGLLLERGVSVILESGFWTRAERDALRLAARSRGAAVDLYVFATDVEEFALRVRLRHEREPERNVDISREDLVAWAALFAVPDAPERSLYDQVIDVG